MAVLDDIIEKNRRSIDEILAKDECPFLGWSEFDHQLGILLGLGSFGLELDGAE